MHQNAVGTFVFGIALVLAAACGGESGTPADATATTATTTITESAAPAVDPAAQLARGKELYDGTCAACHGATGKGDGPGSAALDPKPRDFSNAEYMSGLTDTDIRNTIKYGGAIKGMPQMPSHPQFSEEDLNAIVTYVRTLPQQQPAS